MDTKLLDVLVCPLCKGKLNLDKTNNELICQHDKLAFPIKDGLPMMLATAARSLDKQS